ncbi:NAD(P)/FAD-dependent oxidoreductase [bacterium]|nr:NAD(P)/FAD-dependent oxidoreductase [bacterium]
MENHHDVIVIGSGIGGLAAALTVARAGKNTLVLEAGKAFGGYTNPFKRGAYTFDPGLHYIGECHEGASFSRMLAKLGLADKVRFRELSPDGFDRLVFPGYEVTMGKGHDAYRDKLARDFPHEIAGLDRFFEILKQFRSVARLQARVNARDVIKALPLVPLVVKYGRATYGQLLDDLFGDRLLKAVLAAQGGDYGLPPSRASALIGLGLIDHYLGGAYYPVGGSRALRDAFVDGLHAAGATLRKNRPVKRIVIENGRAIGVACENGEEYFAPRIISNVDAMKTYGDMVGTNNLPPRMRRKVKRTRPSLASICLFIGTDIDLTKTPMTDANVWHYSTTDLDGLYAPLWQGRMPDDDVFFLSAPSLKDPETHVRDGVTQHTVELVTFAPFEPFSKWAGEKSMRRGKEYDDLKNRIADRFIAAAERYIPKLGKHIKLMEVGTPVTNITYAGAPFGAIYGPEMTPEQMGPWRFSPKSPIPGLYLCGSSVMSAGIVPCGMSGYVAGKIALRAGGLEKRGVAREPVVAET